MRYKKYLFILVVIGALTGCAKKLDSLLENPNSPLPETADVDLYLNYVQLSFLGFYTTASDYGAQLTRQQVMFGPLYTNAYLPQSFDGIWTNAYSELIKNDDAMIPLAEQNSQFVQAGIGKLLKAYVLATLVDDFGDVPYSEANLGTENTNPSVDDGASVYNSALALIDDGINDLTASGAAPGPKNDLFYGGDKTKWVTFAKTLKLKLLMQTRLVDNSVSSKIQALLDENDLIDAADGSEDFVFRYSTNSSSPNSRHPHYNSSYTKTGSGDYVGTYFLYELVADKGAFIDPRRRFYVYRQQLSYANSNDQTMPCYVSARPAFLPDDQPFCIPYPVGGYWGRDHGDNSGIPPDGKLRSAWGIYPAGGLFDAGTGAAISGIDYGAKGAGIEPIWLASYTEFLKAEAKLTLGVGDEDPEALLENGVRYSISKVLSFPKSVGIDVALLYPSFYPSQATIDNYVNVVLGNYEGSESTEDQLDVIMKEFYLAAWGNGVEPYNFYRRTGHPSNMQWDIASSDPGPFIRSLLYPSVFVNRNQNAPSQKDPGASNKVFWDNNPDDFIK